MQKRLLKEKLVNFQQRLIELNTELLTNRKRCQENEEFFVLELCGVLDAFENIFSSLSNKEPSNDKSTQRTIKSFQAIYRKLLRILEEKGVSPIVLEDNRAVMELCRVVETREGKEEEGTVLHIIKNGYRHGSKVVRPVEVITAAKPKECP